MLKYFQLCFALRSLSIFRFKPPAPATQKPISSLTFRQPLTAKTSPKCRRGGGGGGGGGGSIGDGCTISATNSRNLYTRFSPPKKSQQTNERTPETGIRN